MKRKHLETDVLSESVARVSYVFDRFERVMVAFSGGKDSTVVVHLVAEEARKRGRRFGLMFIDWEVQYQMTIDHVSNVFREYRDCIDPLWLCLPLVTPNETSCVEPEFTAWDPGKRDLWVRDVPEVAITDVPSFREGMTFEEFVLVVSDWYGGGKPCANLVGIRAQESINRYRSVTSERKEKFDGKYWSTNLTDLSWNFYPIYDWEKEDVWTYVGRYRKSYNEIYDRMYMAGVPLSLMRVDEIFSEQHRRSVSLMHVIEPETWSKVTARISGVRTAELYGREPGVYGAGAIALPEGYTWKAFARMILDSMPDKTSSHYKNKIAVYLKWWSEHGYPEILDEAGRVEERLDTVPTWRKICKTLLRNDYWCIWLGFRPTKTSHYDRYIEQMRNKRRLWGILN